MSIWQTLFPWFYRSNQQQIKSIIAPETLADKVAKLFGRNQELNAILVEMETLLLGADFGVTTTNTLLAKLREQKPKTAEAAVEVLVTQLKTILHEIPNNSFLADLNKQTSLQTMVFFGVNGAGKTTVIGKIAHRAVAAGKKVLLAGTDTFRAGATEQLAVWAQRTNCPMISATEKLKDPAAIAFSALEQAKHNNFDLLLVDTAGRLQNNSNLMAELQKIVHNLSKQPLMKILVVDANTGQNLKQQVQQFSEIVELDGIIVNKFDSTAKAGIILPIAVEQQLPILALGTGEQIDDLKAFDSKLFLQKLLNLQ